MKVHLLLTKEEINIEKIMSDKTVVIFDILLATSTIAACLSRNAKSVIPAINEEEARKLVCNYEETAVLAGEFNGNTIEGFLDPFPTVLIEQVEGKDVVLSTTNGTVAIRKAAGAKKVWAASLLNADMVVEKVIENYEGETVLLVCSGSAGQFSLEDFYGAGFFISCLHTKYSGPLQLTDSAFAAKLFYESNKEDSKWILASSRVGATLQKMGYLSEVEYVSQKNIIQVAPYVKDGIVLPCR